jgi:hypothetical protein
LFLYKRIGPAWATIEVSGPYWASWGRWGAQWAFAIRAHVAVDLLLETVDHRRADQPPGLRTPAHLLVLPRCEFVVTTDGSGDPPRSPQPWQQGSFGVVGLHPDYVAEWLGGLVIRTSMVMEELDTLRALRDALLHTASAVDVVSVRFAAILSQAMGCPDGHRAIIQRCATAAQELQSNAAARGEPWTYHDRGSDLSLWSHQRFMRFLHALPQ